MKDMKVLLVVVFLTNQAVAQTSSNDLNLIVNSIYRIEGGDKTQYPFGIKSIKTNGNYEKARKICINTVNNTYNRWLHAGKTNNFFDFLADRYCPVADDKTGNFNWKRNIHSMLDKKIKIQ